MQYNSFLKRPQKVVFSTFKREVIGIAENILKLFIYFSMLNIVKVLEVDNN